MDRISLRERSRPAEPGEWRLGHDALSSPTPAVRGRAPGRVGWSGAQNGRGMSSFLGWFSITLGVMQLAAPRRMTRLIGLEPGSGTTSLMQTMGLREIGHGVAILSNPRSKEWVGTRVGGDLLDLGLLAVALTRSARPQRTLLATAAVLGATALDIRGTEQLARSRKAPTPDVLDEPGAHVLRSITIERPRQDVYAFWRELTNLPRFMQSIESVEIVSNRRSRWRARGPAGAAVEWDADVIEDRPDESITWRSSGDAKVYHAGTVRFRALTVDSTVVTVEMQVAPPGGMIGSALLKLIRREPGQMVGDDLRRLKQVLETGEVLVSDASAVRGPHAAQPPLPSELH